jgi:hypothetical protein
VGERIINYVVANRKQVSPEVARRYRVEGAEPSWSTARMLRNESPPAGDNLLEEHGVIRHLPRLASLLVKGIPAPSCHRYRLVRRKKLLPDPRTRSKVAVNIKQE